MKVLKANLPEGVKKKFIVKIGKKVKLVAKKPIKSRKKKLNKDFKLKSFFI